MRETTTGTFPLSVIVATSHPWPELEMTLSSLWRQAQEAGAEVIIADGDGRGVPDDFQSRYPGAEYLSKPGASVFALRSLAMRQARGEIIAMTEDHCIVCPDWCRQLVETHEKYPEAAAVGGAVENGSTQHLIDWANYFVAHSPMMQPIESGPADMISLQAGMAFKRWAIPTELPSHGMMEMLYVPTLRKRGKLLVGSNRIVVHHVQSHGFWPTFASHYNNGRSIGGFRKTQISGAARLVRISSCLILPGFLVARAAWMVLSKRRFVTQLVLSLPLICGLAVCHAAGEMVGYCAGPGHSPEKLS